MIIMDFILGFAHHVTNCKLLLGQDLWSSGNNSYEFFKIAKRMVSTWYIGLCGYTKFQAFHTQLCRMIMLCSFVALLCK